MVSAAPSCASTAAPISSLKYGKCHWSGASTTPSTDVNSPAVIFLMPYRPCAAAELIAATAADLQHLQRSQAVLAQHLVRILLVPQQVQRLAQKQPRLVRFDDAIDVTALGGDPRRRQIE